MTPKVPDVMPLALKRDKVYTFSRTNTDTLTLSGTSDSNAFAYSYTLNNLPGPTEFTVLFDQYRIVQVQLRFLPIYGAGEFPGQIYTAIDYDDDTPQVISESLQNDTLQVTELYQPWVRTFNPLASMSVYNSPLLTGYALAKHNQWYDVASPSIKFYGLRLNAPIITGAPAAIAVGQLITTVIVQFKHPR